MHYNITEHKSPHPLINKLVLLLLLLISQQTGINAMAEKKDDKSDTEINALKKSAIRFDRANDIFNAIEYYRQYLSYNSKDAKLTFRLATLYYDTRDYTKAIQFCDSVIHLSQRKFALAYYYKGISCMSLKKYDEATAAFADFKKFYRSKKVRNHYKKLALIYSANSEWAKNNSNKDGKIIVTHEGEALNHADIDFAPFPVNDDAIIYSGVYNDASGQLEPIRQIYKAVRIDGKWKNTGLFDGAINDPDFNTGNAVLSDDGQTIYFTRSRKNWKNEIISEIFVSHFSDNSWQEPEKLPYPINEENFTTTQPALGRNLRTGVDILYFVSNRPGGRGGLDIWSSEYNTKTNSFKEPHNLPKINTVGDECSPFYDMLTQTLYFSSNGMKSGLGGFDIYKTTGSAGKWTEAVPLPKPVNSSYDDYYYSVMKNNKEGFFASNRPGSLKLDNGTCCDDIYSYKIYDCIWIYSHGTVRNAADDAFYQGLNEKYHLGLVYPKNNSALSDVPVELYLTDDQTNDEILVAKTTTDKNGNYSFDLDKDKKYKVLVRNYGYFEETVPVNTFKIDCSDSIAIGTTLIKYLPKVSIVLNIYYDFNDFKLTEDAKQTIDKMVMPLFNLFPNGIIEIGSHTDSVGTEEYNLALSQKRSETVVSYLISQGISPDRLVAKGYGMSVPIAPNTNPDGSDNSEGRQLNRRTEFKVVGEISTLKGTE